MSSSEVESNCSSPVVKPVFRKRTSTRRQDALAALAKKNVQAESERRPILEEELTASPSTNVSNTLLDSSSENSSVESRSSSPPEKRSRDRSTDLKEAYDYSSIDELLKFAFGKTFSFGFNLSSKRRVKEPLYSFEKWTDYELRDFSNLKRKLNSVKDELDHFDLNRWHRHTRTTNPAALVMQHLRNDMKVEFLTQAWCKFYEILVEFRLVSKKSQELYTVHLCEAPGAFVASLNHYLKLNHPNIKWYWKANSLNPYYEGNSLGQMINDDRFMLQTLKQWDFGPDNTGDITHPEYPQHLQRKCDLRRVDLVTADGSFDCQDCPDEQETSVSWLHLKETLAALHILKKGGHFVIKMFTFFECDTICLLYFLARVFESIDVKKPATSKEGNSEVYVVCRCFKGENEAQPYLDELYLITEEQHKQFAMFSYREMSRQFMHKLLECASKFADRQISVIRRNIRLFEKSDDSLMSQFKYAQEKLWQHFVDVNKLKAILPAENIVPMSNGTCWKRTNVIEKREHKRGSHADQVLRKSLPKDDISDKIANELVEFECQCFVRNTLMPDVTIPSFRTDRGKPIKMIQIDHGKPIKMIQSSQFCHGTFIRMRNELIDTLTAPVYNKLSRDKKLYPAIHSTERVCDCRNIFASYSDYNEAQYVAFRSIYNSLLKRKNGDDLYLIGFPLLTQFNVNVLCVLREIFRKIEYKNANVLHLCGLKIAGLEEWKENLNDVMTSYSEDVAVHSFLPLDTVMNPRTPLHSWLVAVNNARLYTEMSEMLTDSR